ncbi:uncharacterized protein LOC123879180 isoform X1 [Maniola jurtina]|uniref:uncharacterized protein LOC123879180 isoform X1 n=1 Tax=Maniola jurtina TaxID=191418 RepID=UPI001E68BA01|nr:uncharacterized protein LOC123879180 isoform X1 [Maniola jurtina]
MPKVIESDVREVVLNVKEFFMAEKEHGGPIIPFDRANDRVAAATGVSLRSVTRIIKEGRLAEASSSKIGTLGKKRKVRKDKLVMNDSDLNVLRQKINEFYTIKKENPTIKKLHSVLKEEIGFEGSREVLRQYIKKIGFRFTETGEGKGKCWLKDSDIDTADC